MTDRPSVSEYTSPPTALAADTHRVEAVDDADFSADEGRRNVSGADNGAARSADPFDFRLNRSADTPMPTGTVLELFTSYLVAASHSRNDALTERLDVARVVVDGTVPRDADVPAGYQSAVASLSATLHVDTAAGDAALERWRRELRDAEATQAAVPTDTTVSLSVVRTPPTAQDSH
ncbi:hypothetical protein [Salinigranum sp.]|uniref:hypothetical protein n=1 Tax=Salinigranum sp. TaxID=1966351 RepID=UPI00356ABCCA